MLKALVTSRLMMAWQAMTSLGGRRKNRKLMQAVMVILMVYVALVIAGLIGFFFSTLATPFAQADYGWLYFALSGVTAFSFCFVSSAFMSQALLFQARDNEMLLAMPIPAGIILLSRMLVLYLFNLVITLLATLPPAIAWAAQLGMSFWQWVSVLLVCLALPLMSLALSSLIGWLLAIVSSRMRRKTLFVTLLATAMMLGYFVLMSQMNRILAQMVLAGPAMARAFQRILPPTYHLGQAIASGNSMSLLLFLLYAIVPFVMMGLLLKHFFIRIATANRGAARVSYVEKPLKANSPIRALTAKELRLFFQSPMYMLNSGFPLIFMLALPVVLWLKPDLIAPLVSQYNVPVGMMGAAAVGVQCLLASSVMISAPSISLEGKTLWQAQSLPVSPGQVLLSKAYAHMVISLPVTLVSGLALGIILRLPLPYLLMIAVLPCLLVALIAMTGVLINVKLPKFDWNSQTEAVKQGASVILTMAAGFVAVALPVAAYLNLLAGVLSPLIFMALYALILMALCVLLYIKLFKRSDREFMALHP